MKLMCRKWVVVPLLVAGVVGCENNTQNGALIGGLGGAAIGGGIGSVSHGRAGEGALIGAAVGAIGGALVGNQMDKNEAKREPAYASSRYESGASRGEYRTVSRQDVVDWSNRGVRDDIIIDRIDRSGTVFTLNGADENRLRDAGVSEDVIRAMKDTARRG